MTSSARSTRHRSMGARAQPAHRASQPFSAYHPHPASPFARFAKWTSRAAGHPLTFLIAVLTIVVWGITGPLFGYSNTWQLVINTGTTIVTFLMVFLIQNTQNRDSAAVQVKLDELIRATAGGQNALLDVEELSDGELELVRLHYEVLAQRARERQGSIQAIGPDPTSA